MLQENPSTSTVVACFKELTGKLLVVITFQLVSYEWRPHSLSFRFRAASQTMLTQMAFWITHSAGFPVQMPNLKIDYFSGNKMISVLEHIFFIAKQWRQSDAIILWSVTVFSFSSLKETHQVLFSLIDWIHDSPVKKKRCACTYFEVVGRIIQNLHLKVETSLCLK